jgi:hypothetical protein
MRMMIADQLIQQLIAPSPLLPAMAIHMVHT